ncbi:MarR family winged helix-turn-helix transcriptional regulator [Pseudonocardia oroxyli]|uniref:DNA-binding transcriptional regulator, MarR family n=1 Tax=Pseudonocardia oroxyli TaxID=366584 RepID=A0A1G7XXL4_PSEOR|nr:MarR family transcriptional regulator [Pseudonocardia oroxyli]SDG88907.1 DNA-binding transcriptional regulator, MarR family [Pseudonocardia oroxyli]
MNDLAPSALRASQDVRTVFGRLRRRLREVDTGGGLTPSQTAVFVRLAKDGDSTASVLAAAEGVRPQSMATILAALDAQGLIERRPDPEDGRRQLITLSAEGRERAAGDRETRREWLARRLHEDFTEAERQTLIDAAALLERLVER